MANLVGNSLANSICQYSVPRRPSNGAQHAGRGGAGNIFKSHAEAEAARASVAEQAVDDSDSTTTTTAPAKGKGWFFGKKA
jgi:hypothetical protein